MLLELTKSLALLFSLCFLYGLVLRVYRGRPIAEQLVSGLLFGGICVLGMWSPIELVPGALIDARTVVLSMAALVCGPWAALLATALAISVRWELGGAGMANGMLVILASSGLGLLYRVLHQCRRVPVTPLAMLVFGVFLHGGLLGLLFLIDHAFTLRFQQQWFMAYLLVFPVATPLLGWLLQDLRQRRTIEDALAEHVAKLQDSEHRLHLLLNDLPAISVQGYRPDGTTVYWNKASELLYGYSKQEAIGKSLLELIIPSPMHDGVRQAMANMFATGVPIPAGELRLQRKDGSLIDVFSSHAFVQVPGQPPELFCLDIDLSARKAAKEEARFLALYDPLTQLPNRRLLVDRLQQALAGSLRSGQGVAVLGLDVDHFKTLNDSQGHAAGDALLVEIARRLQACVRKQDTVARIGGDEFVVLLAELSLEPEQASAQARGMGERMLEALRQPCRIGGQELQPSASIGVAMASATAAGHEELLKQADLAMYRAKSAGRGQMQFFDPLMQAAANERLLLQSELHRALRDQEFVLHYQPQVDAGGAVIGAEVLLRWQHPERGLVAPGVFIPLAEETGQILGMGRWVLETALRQQAQWRDDARFAQLGLSVNVSARQFRQPGFVAELRELLQASGADPRRIKLELTESLLLQDEEHVIALMHELRGMGLSLSLDDFGTGYSSLGYLKRLPLDQIKIDQGFVRNVMREPKDAAIARSIIAMSHLLGLEVIAEGVETELHHQFLLQHDCRYFQGYLFGRPEPLEAFAQRILAQAAAGNSGDSPAASASK